jgi:PAS domain S-box-containing protein
MAVKMTKLQLEAELKRAQRRITSLEKKFETASVLPHDIIERKRAEEALRDTQMQLQGIFDSTVDAIITIDEDQKIIIFNPAAEQMYRCAASEVIGQTLDRFIPEFVRKEHREYLRVYGQTNSTKRTMNTSSLELTCLRADGEAFSSEVSISQIELGGRKLYTAIVRDITERKQAEELLTYEATILENVSDAIIATDLQFNILNMNPAAEALYGWQESEAIGRPAQEIMQNQYAPGQREGIIAAFQEHGKWQGEIEQVSREGKRFPALASIATIRDSFGKSVGIVGVNRDITERKQVEEALHHSEENLRKAQHFAHVGSWTWNVKTNQLDWSDEMYNLFGLDKQTFSGVLSDVIAQAIHPDDRAKVDQANLAVINEGVPSPLEYRVVLSNGAVRFVWAEAGEMIRDEAGAPYLLSGIVQDITERKQAEAAIRQLNETLEERIIERTAQLEAANKELEAFSYSVSHDLRSPLRGIDGWSLALLEDYGGLLDEEGQAHIQRVRAETQRMGNLIDDILKLSRITRAEMNKEKVDISTIAEAVVTRLRETKPKDRRVEFDIQKGLTALGDPKLLDVVLTNLLDNAFKFTGKKQEAYIEFGQTVIEGAPAFFVRDNGAGFDMTYAHKLFGAFQRMHRVAEFPGTGIGLATVQRIIHRHEGSIWASSEIGQGATFYFTLEGNNK